MEISGIVGKNYYDSVKVLSKHSKPDIQEYSMAHYEKSQSITEKKRLLDDAQKGATKPKSIIESTLNYGKSIRESRNDAKNTNAQLRQLRYNFKGISSQLTRSKTSVNAKQVASKARRETVRLKMKLQTGKYDTEEIQAAIEHSKAMERAANKKARHLEQEEMVKVTDKEGYDVTKQMFESELEEKRDAVYEAEYEAELEESEEEISELQEEQIRELELAIEQSAEETREMMEESVSELSEDMFELMSEAMEDMMEESLSELADSMLLATDTEMNEEEFKTYRLKHRTDEDKTILEADAKYLKAMFELYDKRMGQGDGVVSAVQTGQPFMANSGLGSMSIPNIVDISL